MQRPPDVAASALKMPSKVWEAGKRIPLTVLSRRSSRKRWVPGEVYAGDVDWIAPVYSKTSEEQAQLREIIEKSSDSKLKIMFGNLQPDIVQKVIDAMFVKHIQEGEHVIQEGDEGDYFYIVKSGHFDLFKANAAGAQVKVFEAGQGFSFGELGLLYNALRSAPVVATEPSEVWCLERMPFRMLVARSDEERFKKNMALLRRCDVFAELSESQIARLAEVFHEEEFDQHEAILEQGERDDKMYILIKGEAVACIMGDGGEIDVAHYKQGDYFGEIALLLGEPRKASVYATGPVTCMCISRETFNSLLGPLRDFLEANIGKYAKYQEAIQMGARRSSKDLTDRRMSDPMLCFGISSDSHRADGSTSPEDASREAWSGAVERDRRARRMRVPSKLTAISQIMEDEPAAAPSPSDETYGEKMQRDFLNPALSQPDPRCFVPGATIQAKGGWRLGEQFGFDKTAVVRTDLSCSSSHVVDELKWGDRTVQHARAEDTYTWSAPSWLKGSTHATVLCQRNLKEKSDMAGLGTPNQDNYFVVHIDGLQMYGVCDGHGPFGHLVSFRLVQSLPHFISTNQHFRTDWPLCFKEAFRAAQQDLIQLSKEQDVNVESSGASGSVLVFEGPRIHVAHIGDSSCMVGSWNRKDSRLVYGTQDHKPTLPGERERLESAGMEVHDDDERIYLPGKGYPGLTMSRCFGDMCCTGLIQDPEYKEILCQPNDEYYAVIASDGIWEFVKFSEAVSPATGEKGGLDISKKLRLKGASGAASFLTAASRKRWHYMDAGYCDDVTCIIVQWNVPLEGAVHNHQLTIKRPV